MAGLLKSKKKGNGELVGGANGQSCRCGREISRRYLILLNKELRNRIKSYHFIKIKIISLEMNLMERDLIILGLI